MPPEDCGERWWSTDDSTKRRLGYDIDNDNPFVKSKKSGRTFTKDTKMNSIKCCL